MTPFIYKTKIIDMDAGDSIGFLMIRGREDGSWSVHLHHWQKESAGCDVPEACWPAALDTIAQWWVELERRHQEGVKAILSWPDRRPGYRPGWRAKEMNAAHQALKKTAAAWVAVKDQIKKTMTEAGWPTPDPDAA